MSVWVEIYHNFVWVVNIWSRSTWACELKSFKPQYGLDLLWSRSTWACELKWNLVSSAFHKKCHAPRERVSWNTSIDYKTHGLTESRSTWSCELKYEKFPDYVPKVCHAPRERVSWNRWDIFCRFRQFVTLHVSVWVEIKHRSFGNYHNGVTLHVSVWVEIHKRRYLRRSFLSRSTWACELKFVLCYYRKHMDRHAPRERVSWNCQMICLKHELLTSRSTWACELKFTPESDLKMVLCHAPRERVSWNEDYEGI